MSLERLTSHLLEPVPHGFFSRRGGASSGIFEGLNCGPGSSDQAEAVAMNRARVASDMGVGDSELLTLHQVHSADVVTVNQPFTDRPRADAMVTATPGLALGILTADCMPVLFVDLLFTAALGAGATLNDNPISPSITSDFAQAEILAARPVMHAEVWKDGEGPGFTLKYRASLAYRMASVARGRFDAMLTLRPSWEWDIAAGALILSEAGAICTDRTGEEMRFNNPDPRLNGVVAGNPALHPKIIAALA